MPETDIVNTRSDSSTHQVQNPELEVLPPQANEVVEVVPYPVDTVAVWRPKRIEKIDTFYISAYDFPATVMSSICGISPRQRSIAVSISILCLSPV